jgi:signal transduction histidine kinase
MTQPAGRETGSYPYSEIVCPHCGFSNDYFERECKNCGVDLALAMGMAALAFSSLPAAPQAPIAPEILVPRLGEILIEKGLLKTEDLQRALEYQRTSIQAGQSCRFGQSLLALKVIDQDTLDAVVTEQILQLQSALQQSNRQLERRVEERTNDLQQALQKLAELNQLKSNLIANISHELRTPLTHLKGYLNLLVDGSLGSLLPEQTEAIEVMLRAEARLEQLIEDLIQFSLMARGELSLNFRMVNVSDLLLGARARAARLANARNVTVRVKIEEDLPKVRVDYEKLDWVLLQLLDNAIKFSPQGGSVILDATATGGLVTIGVTDTGIGMPPERISEIFEPFHQLDSSDDRHYGGTGLGLALVKRIIEAHGSMIHVQSKVGQGSRFEFSFPVKEKD